MTVTPLSGAHRAFVCYHHANDQWYKDELVQIAQRHSPFLDYSVSAGDIDGTLPDERIRELIRDDYLRDSSVTIVLVGTETSRRRHVDWEIYSSMYNGKINKQSGILIVNLPSTGCTTYTAAHAAEKETIYPEFQDWRSVGSRLEYAQLYPLMPARILDNLFAGASISVTHWDRIATRPERLRFLIDAAFGDRAANTYDLSRPMMRGDL